MAEGASRKSPWAMRLAIAGALLLVIGAIIVSAQKEAIDSVYDPREMSIAQIDDGNSVTFDVQKNGCYMAIVSDNEPDVDVELTPIVGSAAATEKLTPKSCFSDWIPMASDGAGFEIHSQWIVDESGEMLASSSCTGEMCEEQTIWLVHIDNWELKLLESSGLVFGFGICCLGFILLPIAGIIAYSTRSNKIHGSLRVVGRDGELLQSFDTQEEMMAAMKDMNSPLHNDGSNENLGEASEPDDGFVDGSRDVMQGTLMTTEQVYAFMRGDAPEIVTQVEDPFADSPTPGKKPVVRTVANVEEISDWDAGGGNQIEKSSSQPTRRKPIELKEKEPGSDDWSAWDDL